jgi:hypothetical protein
MPDLPPYGQSLILGVQLRKEKCRSSDRSMTYSEGLSAFCSRRKELKEISQASPFRVDQ